VLDQTGMQKICFKFSHHFVVQLILVGSGGFRFASTTGYYLPALWADVRQTEQFASNYFVGLLRTTVIELTLLYW